MTQSKAPAIVVATMLPEEGANGVQVHFNRLAEYARARSISVAVATPHDYPRILRRLAGALTRLIRRVNREWSVIWYRWIDYHCLRWAIRQRVSELAGLARVIYAQDPLSARAGLALRRSLPGLRVVLVAHYNLSEAYEHELAGNTTPHGPLARRLSSVERYALNAVDAVLFPSRFMLEVVAQRLAGLDRAKLRSLPHFTAPPGGRDVAAVDGDIICIGTLEKRKNQALLLHALSIARREGYVYTLTLVGDGPDRDMLESLVMELGLTGQVRVLGRVPNAARLIPGHRVYAHAALTESFGIVLIEALSCGTPVIAPRVGAIPEVIRDGLDGMLYDVDSPQDAARALIQLLSSRGMLERMRAAALSAYKSKFTPDALGGQWLDAILGGATSMVPAEACHVCHASSTHT
jgi:glycosyltransferase involved in cell wall biosynthesis